MAGGAVTSRVTVGNADIIFPPALCLTEECSDAFGGGIIAVQCSSHCIRVGGIAVADDNTRGITGDVI